MVDTSQTAWFLLDRTHADYPAIRTKLATRHVFFWPNNTFSETLNDAKTEGLLKTEGGSDGDWLAINADIEASGAFIRRYSRADHSDAVTLLNTDPGWSNTRTEV
jgi:hypothetical protein